MAKEAKFFRDEQQLYSELKNIKAQISGIISGKTAISTTNLFRSGSTNILKDTNNVVSFDTPLTSLNYKVVIVSALDTDGVNQSTSVIAKGLSGFTITTSGNCICEWLIIKSS